MKINLDIPIKKVIIQNLKLGDIVKLNGTVITARDKAHKYIYENIILYKDTNSDSELNNYLNKYLKNGVIYHCGPIVKKVNNKYNIISAGPTTSIREEKYTPQLIKHFGLSAIIGKGGMGEDTLKALKENNCVYLHCVGGCAVKIAKSIIEVVDVKRLDFGIPEAMWVLKVKDLIAYVTMDCRGNSLHKNIYKISSEKYKDIINII